MILAVIEITTTGKTMLLARSLVVCKIGCADEEILKSR